MEIKNSNGYFDGTKLMRFNFIKLFTEIQKQTCKHKSKTIIEDELSIHFNFNDFYISCNLCRDCKLLFNYDIQSKKIYFTYRNFRIESFLKIDKYVHKYFYEYITNFLYHGFYPPYIPIKIIWEIFENKKYILCPVFYSKSGYKRKQIKALINGPFIYDVIKIISLYL